MHQLQEIDLSYRNQAQAEATQTKHDPIVLPREFTAKVLQGSTQIFALESGTDLPQLSQHPWFMAKEESSIKLQDYDSEAGYKENLYGSLQPRDI